MKRESEVLTSDSRFGEALATQVTYLKAFACRLCRNVDYAEDLAQDTLLSAWQARRSFREGTNLQAWLTTILRNKFYSDYRRRRRAAPWNDYIAGLNLWQPEEGFAAITLAQAMGAIDVLPADQKIALIAIGIDRESYAKEAALLECPVGTLKSRVARARASLARTLEGQGPTHAGPRHTGTSSRPRPNPRFSEAISMRAEASTSRAATGHPA